MACSLDPLNPWPHIWAGDVFVIEKEYADAKMAFEEALSIEKERKPKDHDLMNTLQKKIQNSKSMRAR